MNKEYNSVKIEDETVTEEESTVLTVTVDNVDYRVEQSKVTECEPLIYGENGRICGNSTVLGSTIADENDGGSDLMPEEKIICAALNCLGEDVRHRKPLIRYTALMTIYEDDKAKDHTNQLTYLCSILGKEQDWYRRKIKQIAESFVKKGKRNPKRVYDILFIPLTPLIFAPRTEKMEPGLDQREYKYDKKLERIVNVKSLWYLNELVKTCCSIGIVLTTSEGYDTQTIRELCKRHCFKLPNRILDIVPGVTDESGIYFGNAMTIPWVMNFRRKQCDIRRYFVLQPALSTYVDDFPIERDTLLNVNSTYERSRVPFRLTKVVDPRLGLRRKSAEEIKISFEKVPIV